VLYYELPVYRDTYRLILKVFEYTQEFPREYKYSLGQDMKRHWYFCHTVQEVPPQECRGLEPD